jgi:membrane fusion protein (multidrug efflux system)
LWSNSALRIILEVVGRIVSYRLSGLISIAVATMLLTSCGKPPGTQGAAPPTVTVVTLKAQPIDLTRELPGRTRAYQISEVRPQVNGVIKRRLFTEGAFVQEGQSLYELDDAIYQAQAQSAEAALQKAQATLHVAQLAASRADEIRKIGAISQQDHDNAIATLEQAKADVAAAEANLASSKVNLRYARIAAPIAGRIGGSTVTPGALVTANQSASLATVTQLDPIYVDVNQSGSEWLALKQEIESGRVHTVASGASTKIVLPDGSMYQHEGKLQFADVIVDPATGNLMLRIIVPNPEGLLMPGMYVRAIVNEGVLQNGILVPQRGVTRDNKGMAVAMVVDAANTVQLKTLKTSRAVADQWLVEEGLAAGDRVIVEGIQKVQPGKPANPVEESASSSSTSVTQ